MREHEVPTHMQAEDKVLLWFTFPQIVALTAVCALAYGAYRYAPVGPSEVRMALAVVLGLAGVATIVGKIGGRRLPLVAADLLRFGLGARRYAGPPAQLARNEPPAPAQSEPGPLKLLAKRARRGLPRLRRDRERRNGRMPFRPRAWFGKRCRGKGGEDGNGRRVPTKHRMTWLAAMAVAALAAAAAAVPQAALAGDHWGDEIGFEIPAPVAGRRLFVEGLEVSGDRAEVTLRAATGLDLRVRAYGGPEGRELRFWGSASLEEGERTDYSLPLSGGAPSLAFSWEDGLGQAGAFTLKDEQIPYPLPSAEGDLCDLSVVSLGWTPESISGVIASECAITVEERVALPMSDGHHAQAVTVVMDAEVTSITGTVAVTVGGSQASVPFVPDGETRFSLSVEEGEALHAVAIEAGLQAGLRIAAPPLVRLSRHPERTEYRTETVSLVRPGTNRTVSETVTVTHPDGATTEHTVTATLSIPSEVVYQDVTLTIVHPEYIRAEVEERAPIARSRGEALALVLSVGADAPFEVLALPEPTPEPVSAEQTPLTEEEIRYLFDPLGWSWP